LTNGYGVSALKLYIIDIVFDHKSDPFNLDPCPFVLETNRGYVLTKTNQHVKYESSDILVNRNQFLNKIYYCDLLPSELSANRDDVLTKTNQHVKYKTSVINSSQGNER